MGADLPDYYFRVRENGAVVFRVDTQNRQQRIEMDQIAMVNVKNGVIRPHSGIDLTADDLAAIQGWLDARVSQLDMRQIDDIHRTVDHLNLTTQWAQSRASAKQLYTVTDTLLLAMHDLRTVLTRKKADHLRDPD